MKTIAVTALKGGVGKSSVVAGLGIALVNLGYKVGFIDLDVTGSNLYAALGLESSPKWQLDTVNEKVVVPGVNGYWLLSVASSVGEDNAVLWERSHHTELTHARDALAQLKNNIQWLGREVTMEDLEKVRRKIDGVLASSKWRYVTETLSDDVVTWPEPLDFCLIDLPPSTSSEMLSFFEHVKDLFGVFIVAQPTRLANTGLRRTIDLLRVRQIPILGMVANQDYYLTSAGQLEYQFASPRVDPQAISRKAGIPFLVSIPQCADQERLGPYFSELATKIVSAQPTVLKDVTMVKKLKRKVFKGIARRL